MRYKATGLGSVIAQQGRTQEWVARQGGIHPSHLCRLLAGQRTITEDAARAIANALGVPVSLLFEAVTD